MIFHFTLKLLELFKCFRLVFHQVDITISTQIISEGYFEHTQILVGIFPTISRVFNIFENLKFLISNLKLETNSLLHLFKMLKVSRK